MQPHTIKGWAATLALAGFFLTLAPVTGAARSLTRSEVDRYPAWRAAAARVLAASGDANSLATAAALIFWGPPSRPKTETGKAATAALELAAGACEHAPDNPALSWLRLLLCMNSPGCDIRQAATTLRWVAADNGAAWLPTLTLALKDKDAVEVDRVLSGMAEGTHFDLYVNTTTVLMYDALKKARGRLPAGYLPSDAARFAEAVGIANAAVSTSFSPIINACRDPAADLERRDACLLLSKTMQRSDVVLAQLVGFAVEKRLNVSDVRELRGVAERRRLLEWRVAAANQVDSSVLPWLKNLHARWRIDKMRALPREEDVNIAILREYKIPLDPPEEHR